MRLVKLRVKVTLTRDCFEGMNKLERMDFMDRVLFEDCKIKPDDLSAVVAYKNLHVRVATFWKREAYEAFWGQHAALVEKGLLKGLNFEQGDKERNVFCLFERLMMC